MADDGDVERAVPAAPVSRVSGRVRTLPLAPLDPGPVEDRGIAVHVPAIARWLTLVGMVAAVALTVVTQDVRWGVVGGAALVAGIALRRAAGRVSFSFGEGFLPYRSDLGWPSGVQEDDDVHWAWADGRPG